MAIDQELFDGEVRETIQDDENIVFRSSNPSTPGSRVISWANFKKLLRSLFVSTSDNDQNIDGNKAFLKPLIVPDATEDLQAVNLRTLKEKAVSPEHLFDREVLDNFPDTYKIVGGEGENISNMLWSRFKALFKKSATAEISDPEAESISETATTQQAINVENATKLKNTIIDGKLKAIEADTVPDYLFNKIWPSGGVPTIREADGYMVELNTAYDMPIALSDETTEIKEGIYVKVYNIRKQYVRWGFVASVNVAPVGANIEIEVYTDSTLVKTITILDGELSGKIEGGHYLESDTVTEYRVVSVGVEFGGAGLKISPYTEIQNENPVMS